METLELECAGSVAWVWLNQARRLNAINQTTLGELSQVFGELESNSAIRAVVLASRGPAFSAGFDVGWMAGLSPDAVANGANAVRAVFDRLETFSRPLIAVVDGAAMGGGLLLALVADFRLASERASFGAPEVKIGIFPSLGLIPRLERIVGLGAAKRLVLTGEPMEASQAHGCGLADALVSHDQLAAEAKKLAEQLAGLPAGAVQMSKAAFQASRLPGYDFWENEKFAVCWALPEREQAMRAFLAR